MTVQLVESDRTKFSRIVDDKEFYERSALVRTSRDRLERAKAELQSPAVLAKLRQDERAKAMRRATTDAAAASAVTMTEQNQQHQQNAAASDSLAARQSLLMQHQDDTLDELSLAVTRVNFMADSIHEEIGQQNKMLTTMEEDLTNVEEELGMVMGKLAKFLKTKDSWQLGTIVCLLATTIVLFFFLVYV